MSAVAEIFRLHGPAYRQQSGARLLPSQAAAMDDIERCRTPYFGGHLWWCPGCKRKLYSYHSCGNRHCPGCQQQHGEHWWESQRSLLLPCAHYLLTLTLPCELRALAYAHQKKVYHILFRAAVEALQQLADDPRYVGGQLAAIGVLHTWTRTLLYHPHVHLLVPAGGWSEESPHWVPARNPAFLVPVRALARIFRAKVCDRLAKAGLLHSVPPSLWHKAWVVHCEHAGRGDRALAYLARYVFRVAITNRRIEGFEGSQVTFRYRDNRTQRVRRVTVPACEFIRRFLCHVLPRGFVKVRYFGFLSSRRRSDLDAIRSLLPAPSIAPANCEPPVAPCPAHAAAISPLPAPHPPRCPFCKVERLQLLAILQPVRAP